MGGKQRIELYLDSKKLELDSKNPYYSAYTGRSSITKWKPWHDDCHIVLKGMFGLSDAEKKFISQLEQLASDEDRELKIYDVNTFRHGVRAYLKGVDETPTIILGRKKFTKDIYETEWSSGFENKQKCENTLDRERLGNGLILIGTGIGLGLLAVILRSSRICCFSALFSVILIAIGGLVIFGDVLDRFFDWAN